MKTSILTVVFACSAICFADLQIAGIPPKVPTQSDARNALVSMVIGWVWIIIAVACIVWIVWWGVRMRRKR